MSKINILDSKVYNRISAGEVVERPSSVVKELIENSIDAKSTDIKIEVFNGGISRIKITDNGVGLEKDDMRTAFLPHATSKIKDANDLDEILTLGFRGEALASIASVSKINLISRQKDCEIGYSVKVEDGEISDINECGCNIGTQITVDSIFYNTPVRAKFLKTPKSEASEISNIISRLILGNPSISFEYYLDDRLVFQSFGGNIEDALIAVYGKEIIENCFELETDKYGIKIKGYIGKHSFSKPNRTYQTMILNGRYITNNTISSAITNAYGSYLMKRNYPFYVLYVDVLPSTVDVNVHPSKADVRFSNNQVIYGAIYNVISSVLDGSGSALKIVKENKTTQNDSHIVTENLSNIKKIDDSFNGIKNDSSISQSKSENTIFSSNFYDKKQFSPIKNVSGANIPNIIDINKEEEPQYTSQKESILFCDNKAKDNMDKNLWDYFHSDEKKDVGVESNISNGVIKTDEIDTKKENIKEISTIKKEQINLKIEKEMKYIGQIFNTFLILENGDDMFMVDQHAGHERIIYDNLQESIKNSSLVMQSMLIPFILNVNSEENIFLNSNLEYFNEIGIEIEEFGDNTFKISSIPTEIANINLKDFFEDYLKDMSNLKLNKQSDIIKEKIMQKACKSAVKAGDKLSLSEIQKLMKMLDGNLGLKCPHGRPIAIQINRKEIDKWFKRIV